jgi:uncharacterized protein (UPF0332 family)
LQAPYVDHHQLYRTLPILIQNVMCIYDSIGTRSVVNRAYYAIFYGIIALFIHENVEHKTSKHSGIISIFDKSIVN